jgi:hypothetical protein
MNFGFNKKNVNEGADFQSQLQEANQKLSTISPLVKSIYSNLALHLLGRGMDLIIEFSLYLAGLGCLVFIFIMNKVFPFHVLGEIVTKDIFKQAITNTGDMEMFNMGVKGLVAIIGILFIIMGMMKNSASKRKRLLQKSGVELKSIEAFYLNQKRTIESHIPKTEAVVETSELKIVEAKEFPPTIS